MPAYLYYQFRGVADFFGGGDNYDGENGMPLGTFRSQYRCYSVAMYGGNYREDVDSGGKSERISTQHVIHLYFHSYYASVCPGSVK